VPEKMDEYLEDPLFLSLSLANRQYAIRMAHDNRLSVQEIRIFLTMLRDWEQWEMLPLSERLDSAETLPKKRWFARVRSLYESDRNDPIEYTNARNKSPLMTGRPLQILDGQRTLLGRCPVASDKTRCCNLQTLDSVMGCGFGCHYCSIQSFYNKKSIMIHKQLGDKLDNLDLDPEKYHHIGTGQGSDSLLWGNQYGLLDQLAAFCRKNPRVILEMKSKSDNITWFLENPVPRNMILTWSLNPEPVITHEEPGTALLKNRLSAARKMANKGVLIGFHFHPIIRYKGWKEDYQKVAESVRHTFSPEELVMISLGTLTYPKKALQSIRLSPVKTKVLKMPFTDLQGKFSYPTYIKEELFKTVYAPLSDWNGRVFFYLCMEEPALWEPVLGRVYQTNEAFESDMLGFYAGKIDGQSLSSGALSISK
jgi:spore photoproduct lyase